MKLKSALKLKMNQYISATGSSLPDFGNLLGLCSFKPNRHDKVSTPW